METKRKRIIPVLKRLRETLVMTKRERNILLFVIVSFLAGDFLILYQRFTKQSPNFSSKRSFVAGKAENKSQKLHLHLQKVDINKASLEDLTKLPGIGKSKAQNIITTRNKLGRFESIDDLLKVRGIGPKLLKKLRPYIKVE